MASNSPPHQDDQNSQQQGYEQRHSRINKPDMFMNIALWMEMSTLAECPDNFGAASSTGLSIFIPRVRENVIEELKNHVSPFARGRINEEAVTAFRRKLDECYWSDEWINDANIVLGWPAFSDKMKEQTVTDMKNLMEWIARATLADVPEDVVFAEIDPDTLREKPVNIPTGDEGEERIGGGMKENIPSIPTTNDPNWQKHALHMCRLAQMLSQRSDDPTKRVGCVLMIHNEVVAIGWNGFPAKALYGEFPRASNTDETREKKEPYVIHAEHNALLTRNKRNLKDDSSILFSNKIPAPQCVPMLIAASVKNVVVPHEPTDDPENQAFFNALKSGKLVGYWPKEAL
ncbi:hypothetical protein QZH41_002947 [Actinostola sp. cb2023]|nr:hypothetical protein QZH41_002947 [Actinostola sp. cb2023]